MYENVSVCICDRSECVFVCVTGNDSECNEREGAILLLITELMTHYAPADMQHGRLMHTHTHTHPPTHPHTHTHRIMAKSASVLTQRGRLLCKGLDSEIAG